MMRSFAIGDVHGHITALERLLEQLPLDWHNDEIIFMGDLIDRGPSPRRVLELTRELQARAARVQVLRGNHEQILLDCYQSKRSFSRWLRMGADTTIADYCPAGEKPRWSTFVNYFPQSWHDYLEMMPIYYRNEHATFVHAGARRTDNGWEIDSIETALWYRERKFWQQYKGETLVVGHTPTNKIRKLLGEPLQPVQEMEAWQSDSLIAIDCGAGHGGRLCAVELPARRFYYQPV